VSTRETRITEEATLRASRPRVSCDQPRSYAEAAVSWAWSRIRFYSRSLCSTGCVLFLLMCYVFSLLTEIYRFAAATRL